MGGNSLVYDDHEVVYNCNVSTGNPLSSTDDKLIASVTVTFFFCDFLSGTVYLLQTPCIHRL